MTTEGRHTNNRVTSTLVEAFLQEWTNTNNIFNFILTVCTAQFNMYSVENTSELCNLQRALANVRFQCTVYIVQC